MRIGLLNAENIIQRILMELDVVDLVWKEPKSIQFHVSTEAGIAMQERRKE